MLVSQVAGLVAQGVLDIVGRNNALVHWRQLGTRMRRTPPGTDADR